MRSCGICLSLSDWLHLVWESLVASMWASPTLAPGRGAAVKGVGVGSPGALSLGGSDPSPRTDNADFHAWFTARLFRARHSVEINWSQEERQAKVLLASIFRMGWFSSQAWLSENRDPQPETSLPVLRVPRSSVEGRCIAENNEDGEKRTCLLSTYYVPSIILGFVYIIYIYIYNITYKYVIYNINIIFILYITGTIYLIYNLYMCVCVY